MQLDDMSICESNYSAYMQDNFMLMGRGVKMLPRIQSSCDSSPQMAALVANGDGSHGGKQPWSPPASGTAEQRADDDEERAQMAATKPINAQVREVEKCSTESPRSKCEETVEAWLTEAQWADLYKSPLVASEIKAAQSAGPPGGSWKPDPNFPHVHEVKLFKGFVKTCYIQQRIVKGAERPIEQVQRWDGCQCSM